MSDTAFWIILGVLTALFMVGMFALIVYGNPYSVYDDEFRRRRDELNRQEYEIIKREHEKNRN